MSLEGFRNPPSMKAMKAESAAYEEFAREYNKIVAYLKSLRNLVEKRDREHTAELIRLDDHMGLPCTDETDFSVADGELQYFDDSGDMLGTGVDRFRVVPVFGVPYDSGEIVATAYHPQSGRRIPLNMRTVRHVRTVLDSDGDYPVAADAASGPCVYPFKFMRMSFSEVIGAQEPAKAYMCPATSTPDGYFMNLMCDELLEVGSILPIYHVAGQWWARQLASCDSVSSGSSSNDSSASSSPSSDVSSDPSSNSSNLSSPSSNESSPSSDNSNQSSPSSNESSPSSDNSNQSSPSSQTSDAPSGPCGICTYVWDDYLNVWNRTVFGCTTFDMMQCTCSEPGYNGTVPDEVGYTLCYL